VSATTLLALVTHPIVLLSFVLLSGMEYDRKSAVSSFYGARRSTDPLNDNQTTAPLPSNAGHASQYAPHTNRTRVDSASSYYADRQSRRSHDMLNPGQSAGYNASSFFDVGRQEPLKGGADEQEEAAPQNQPWDIYADFNNSGPRYSTAFGIGQRQQEAGYVLFF